MIGTPQPGGLSVFQDELSPKLKVNRKGGLMVWWWGGGVLLCAKRCTRVAFSCARAHALLSTLRPHYCTTSSLTVRNSCGQELVEADNAALRKECEDWDAGRRKGDTGAF